MSEVKKHPLVGVHVADAFLEKGRVIAVIASNGVVGEVAVIEDLPTEDKEQQQVTLVPIAVLATGEYWHLVR